jgi:hypothetical protein
MSDDMIALSRRAVACRGWRWMAGARWIVTRAAPLEDYAGRIVEGGRRAPDGPGLPDLTDAATIGCLLALVREAWGDPGFYTARGDVRIKDTGLLGWDFFGYLRGKSCKGMLYRSEAEALVAALESAP